MTAPRLSASGKRLGRPPRAEAPPSAPTITAEVISKAMQDFKAKYDAAGHGRRMAGWNPPSEGPNRAIKGATTIRNRSRDARRNDWSGESVTQKWSTNLIGIGITARFKRIKNKKRRQEITDLFYHDFSPNIDADGVADYFLQQTLSVESWVDGGECFARKRSRFADEFKIPLQIQLLEAEMVPIDFNVDSFVGLPVGNIIRSGIEFNNRGKRIAYWVYKTHPDDDKISFVYEANMFVRVAASEITHIFRPKRPGQIRGVSMLAPVLARLRSIGDYQDTVLERQKLANLFVMFIKRELPTLDPSNPMYGALTGALQQMSQSGEPLVPLRPGLIQELEDGQSIDFANPPEAGTTYSDYIRTEQLGTAAGTGLPYELFSGDIQNVSDRTLRVIINEFRRLAQQNQWQVIIPMYCQVVIEWFVDACVLAGLISLEEADDVRLCEHAPHGWEYIHPVQDPQGKILEVEAGFRSRSSVIGERGDDRDEVDQEREDDKASEDEHGLTPIAPAATPAADPNADPQEQQDTQEQQATQAFIEEMRAYRAAQAGTPAPAPAAINVHAHIAAPVVNPPAVQVVNEVKTPDVTVQVAAPDVTVNNEVKTPNVTVNNEVHSPDVNVEVAAPNVEVHNEVQPAEVKVELPDRKTTSAITRDEKGNITNVVQTEKSIK